LEALELIQACKNHQSRAQKVLFEQFAPSMLTVCKRYLGNDHDAEEVMLSGFLQFFQKIHQFEYRGAGSISAYLRQIMVNQSLMHLRRREAIIIEEVEDTVVGTQEDPIAQLSATEIMQLITNLPSGYRLVFNLYVIEGMSHKQIASLLHIRDGTSKSQLSKARAMLRQMIIKMEDHGIKS